MENLLLPILVKYNLRFEKTIRESDSGLARSALYVLSDSLGRRYTLKIFGSDDINAKFRFLNEISHIRKLRNSLISKYKDWIPVIKWYSTRSQNPYYIYEYIDSEPIGQFIKDFGIRWGQFKHKNFDNFINFFSNLNDLDSHIFEKDLSRSEIQHGETYNLGNWGIRTARKELQHYLENVSGLLPSDDYDKVFSFLEAHGKAAFKYKCLSHRDLYPENILLKAAGSSKFKFLDWEYLSEVPIGYDAAFLYLLFWREEYWKSKIMAHFYNKYKNDSRPEILRNFTISFRFCLVVLAIRFLYQLEVFGNHSTKYFEDANLSFLYDLKTAISGEIVKPRNIKFYLCLDDIKYVAGEYDIGEVKGYEVFYASKGNTVAKVATSRGRYIFRFYSISRSTRLIRRELDMFERLSDKGVRTYDVLRSNHGEQFLGKKLYGKSRKVAVLTYLSGARIKKLWSDEAAAINAGEMLRRIHNANIVHNDYSKENVLFIKNRVVGVIDFEWGRKTNSKLAKLSDLAKAIALWLIDVRYKSIEDTIFVRCFLKGYFDPLGLSSSRISKSFASLDDIYSKVLDKINEEEQIFLTTIDKKRLINKALVRRFIAAENVIKNLMLADKG